MQSLDIEEQVKWYEGKRPLYAALAENVKEIIEKVLQTKNLSFQEIIGRAKTIESFRGKIEKKIYFDPKEMQDLAGIYVITYLNSDVEKISEVIKSLFLIDTKLSGNKSEDLGTNRVGYRSIHFVANFTPNRVDLPEYKKFEGLKFEIQVRTILQHAWAQIFHDRRYKFHGVLPKELDRRLYLTSGLLEVADNDLDSISMQIDRYTEDVAKKTKEGNLNIQIDSTSIREYIKEKFRSLPGLSLTFGIRDELATIIIDELNKFGVKTLLDLEKVIPKDFEQRSKKYFLREQKLGTNINIAGVLRICMLITNPEKYFKEAWQNSWQGLTSASYDMLKEFNPEIDKVLETYRIIIPKKKEFKKSKKTTAKSASPKAK